MTAQSAASRQRDSTRGPGTTRPGPGAALLVACLSAAITAPVTLIAEGVPAIVAITLDTSGSVDPERLLQAADLARGVLESLPPDSQLALFTFDDTSRLVLERTSDAEQVVAALESVQRAGRQTALHDALYDASVYLRDAPPGRKAILLVTDGRDERSAVRLEDGLDVARDGGIPVFAVGVGRADEDVLRRVAKLTGGRYSRLEDASGFEIASLVLEMKPVPGSGRAGDDGDVATGSDAGTPVRTDAAAVAGGLSSGALTLLLGLGAALLAAAGWVALRKRPARRTAPGPDAPDDNATVLVRTPEIAPVAKTVLLSRNPALEVIEGPRTGARFPLSEARAVSLGRGPGNDVVLDDDAVSSEHCRVRPEQGEFVLYDLDSTNGTFVNGRRVSRHTLLPGDSIRVGASQLEYRLG